MAYATVNPYTGEKLKSFPDATEEQVKQAIDDADKAFAAWRTTPFATRAAGVVVPPDILAKYPQEMTVVLQHQYEDLRVEDERFSVKLRFGGLPKNLVIPYAAITRFFDPSVQFMLQFEEPAVVEAAEDPPVQPTELPPASDGPKVVSLDQFRKK